MNKKQLKRIVKEEFLTVLKTAIKEVKYRVTYVTKDGEKGKSGIFNTKKKADDHHYKLTKSKNLKSIEVIKESLNEHWLGELPSEKLMKMKWNPVTDPIQEDVYDSSDLKTPYPDRGDGVDFDEFMSNIRNYSSSDERDDLLTYLTDQIIKNYTDSDLNDLMYEMSMEFEVGPDGNHFEDLRDTDGDES